MAEEQIREYAKSKGFHPQTLTRWLGWSPADREALYELAAFLRIGENHLRDLMDWLEEIALRDRCRIKDRLAQKEIVEIESDPRLGRADKLKRIKERLRRDRFPRLSAIEDAIRARIQELKLPTVIKLSVPPGLEGGELHVEFRASRVEELQNFGRMIADAAGQEAAAEIFHMLSGDALKSGPTR